LKIDAEVQVKYRSCWSSIEKQSRSRWSIVFIWIFMGKG